ncbi:GbsR/MarR family transcriptional regulator [Oceanithermus desulfurans]|uniref:HTH marR-type domain-containing protein n=2 Tax=Oceanithermus desulfurans TaxID=227924 RepID=A0A511RLG0_9DEIN|nr:MarR family transcriptional regulator [Oceanithermus desulfurans]MBB6029079.1 DNA-binding transcriptional regulator GbsR (MarR family) [Oceanithermus desulfurans]GEM90470.1 hypothetical protein ODE01S_19040 [Oceanithermus desulfurans NBRC 100063]
MNPDDSARRQLAEQMGLAFEAFGTPRMAGRVLGWMLLAEEDEIALEELARQLGVSKASVSHATRLLEQMGALRRVARPGTRQAFYALAEDPWSAMLAVEERVSRGFARFAREARAALASHPRRDARLAEMEAAFALYLELLATFARRWKARKEAS